MDEATSAELARFRQSLHRQPELSGEEFQTARSVIDFLKPYNPSELISDVGETGVVAIFEGQEEGPFIGVRAELDALPIQEKSSVQYRSEKNGVAHLCGHDGHMTMVAGLAILLKQNPLKRGKIALIFQPAEENGRGALAMLEDIRFSALKMDRIVALHNLPGYPLNTVVGRSGSFNAASVGMKIRIEGKTSHAAEPEKGLNPAKALNRLMDGIIGLSLDNYHDKDLQLVTPIYARLGEEAFGTSPGEASCGFTLRTFDEAQLKQLQAEALKIYNEVLDGSGLTHSVEWIEYFRPIINSQKDLGLLKGTAEKLGLNFENRDLPFRWCEDFSFFDQLAPTFYFGLGSGLDQPALHNPDFDFPDALSPVGTQVFFELIKAIADA